MTSTNFSLRKAILANLNGKPQGAAESRAVELATNAHSKLDSSAKGLLLPVGTRAAYTAKGHPIMQTEKAELLLPLDDLVLAKAGARMLTGLVGDLTWGEHTGITAKWEGEGEPGPVYPEEGAQIPEFVDAGSAAGKFKKHRLFKPKRLTAFVTVSKQLLLQDSMGVDRILEDLLMSAVMNKLEQTVFGTSSGEANIPDGLFVNVPSKGAINWEDIVDMEDDLANAKALKGNLAYLTHPKLITRAKKTLKDVSGGGGFIANGKINDYPAFRTTNVPAVLGAGGDEYGVVFGNWDDFFIGQWGAIEITTNPYTWATKGLVDLVINSYWDFGILRSESFAIASMK